MDWNKIIDWIFHPVAISLWLVILGVAIKVWLENTSTPTISWVAKVKDFFKPAAFVGEALVIVGLVEAFMGITLIKNTILEGVRETLIDYRFMDDLNDEAHRKILTRIIANKFELDEKDPVVVFYSKELSNSLRLPSFIQNKKVTYNISLKKDGKDINLERIMEKTVYLGRHASHENESIYPGIYDYTLRINGKDCVKFNLENKSNLPPDELTVQIDKINCQFKSVSESKPMNYRFIDKISAENSGEGVRYYIRESSHINNDKYTDFISLAERIENLEVTVKYPAEKCKVSIIGTGRFEENAKEAKNKHDSNPMDEFHHMFDGEYGPESVLFFNVDCSGERIQ